MTVRLRNAIGTSTQWTEFNPILLEGEIGVASDFDPVRIKIGDGVSSWIELAYWATSAAPSGSVSNPLLEDLDAAGFDLVNPGSVAGRDVAADGAKLDAVESGATADQSAAEIKTAYENNADTNEFSDAEQAKLAGISGTNTGDELAATESAAGIVELSTSVETTAGLAVQASDTRLSDTRTPTAHTHTLTDVTNSGALASLNSVSAAEIDANSVTNARLADMSTQTIKGRTTAAPGDPEDLTAAQVRTVLNVANGATANTGALADLDSVDTGQIDPQAVGTSEITDLAVTPLKLAALAVTTPKIADQAVAMSKLPDVGQGTFVARTSASAGSLELTSAADAQAILEPHQFPPVRYQFSDFHSIGSSNNSPWLMQAINGGTQSATPPAAALVAGTHGIALLRSSTTANSGYCVRGYRDRTVGQADLFYRCISAAPDDFTNKTLRLGFSDSPTSSADPVDGAYFELIGSSTVSANCQSSNSKTTSGTTFTLVAGTYYTFEIYWTSTSSINFKILSLDGATTHLDVDITTNIPTGTSRAFGAGCWATSSGTAVDDLLWLDYQGVGFRSTR